MKFKPNPLLYSADEDFSINFMQSGRGRAYLDAFMEQLRLSDIPVRLVGEERYGLCDTVILN